MIITETITDTGETYVYTYSDAGFAIQQDQTGQIYQDAMDMPNSGYTYTETDALIYGEDAEDVYAQAGHILLGE